MKSKPKLEIPYFPPTNSDTKIILLDALIKINRHVGGGCEHTDADDCKKVIQKIIKQAIFEVGSY